MMRCPFCHAGIETREEGVRCTHCHAPHHLGCWNEHGKCSVFGCGSTDHKKLTALGTARIVLAAGKAAVSGALAEARERMGGKSVVLLFMLSCIVPGLGLAPLLYHVHASRKVELEFLLGSLFVVMATWITALLYRGAAIDDDMDLKVAGEGPGKYYFFISRSGPSSSTSSTSGCWDLNGCSGSSSSSGCSTGSEADGVIGGILLILAAILVIVVVLPFVAWLAVEVLFPCVVLSVYFTLYGALAFAVNKQEALAGRLLPCIARALIYATVYTGIVAILIGVGVKLFHMYAPLH